MARSRAEVYRVLMDYGVDTSVPLARTALQARKGGKHTLLAVINEARGKIAWLENAR